MQTLCGHLRLEAPRRYLCEVRLGLISAPPRGGEVMGEPTKIPPCKRCGGPQVEKENAFYWRGRWFNGIVCEKDNILSDHPDDSFLAAVADEMSRPSSV